MERNKSLEEVATRFLRRENAMPDMFYHATFNASLPSIKRKGLDTRGVDLAWEDSQAGIVYLSDDPEVAASYAEAAENISDEIYDSGIVILHIPRKNLDDNKLHDDRNVRSKDHSQTYEYHGTIPFSSVERIIAY